MDDIIKSTEDGIEISLETLYRINFNVQLPQETTNALIWKKIMR